MAHMASGGKARRCRATSKPTDKGEMMGVFIFLAVLAMIGGDGFLALLFGFMGLVAHLFKGEQ